MSFITARLRDLRKNSTKEERIMWQQLREYRNIGYVFRRQYVIGIHFVHGTRYFFIADFVCVKAKLIVEIDGPIHKFQQEYDKFRQKQIESDGFTVLRFTNLEVNNQLIQVCRKIESALPGFPSRT